MSYPIKDLPTLPAERALKVIAGRWKTVILHRLFEGRASGMTLRRCSRTRGAARGSLDPERGNPLQRYSQVRRFRY